MICGIPTDTLNTTESYCRAGIDADTENGRVITAGNEEGGTHRAASYHRV